MGKPWKTASVFLFWKMPFLVYELVSCFTVAENQLAVHLRPVFSASSFRCAPSYSFRQPAVVTVVITSHLVDPVTVDSVAVSLLPAPTVAAEQFEVAAHRQLERQTSQSSFQSQQSGGSATSANIPALYSHARETVRQSSQPVDLVEYVELAADSSTVSACGVVCQAAMHRSPSAPMPLSEHQVVRRGDWDLAFTTSNCVLLPGDNAVQLTAQASF